MAGNVNRIIRDRDGTKHDVLSQQEAMLRLAERDFGLTAKRIAAETGIPLSTVQSWKRATAPAQMSLGDFVAICRIVPDHLTSLCLEPADKQIVATDEPDEVLNELLEATADYTSDHVHRASDGVLCHIDKSALREKAQKVGSLAMKAGRAG